MREKEHSTSAVGAVQRIGAVEGSCPGRCLSSWNLQKCLSYNLLLLLAMLSCINAQQIVGDWCTTLQGESGVCKPFRQCERAMQELSQGVRPKICRFDHEVPIVCCKSEASRPSVRPNPNRPGNQRPGTNNPSNWPDFNNPPPKQPALNGNRPVNQRPGANKPFNVPDFNRPPPRQPVVSGNNPVSAVRPSGGFSRPQRRISEIKCDEYSELVTDRIEGLPLVLDPDPVSFDVAKCPQAGLELIVGGEETKPGEFPHMAAIGYRRQNSQAFDWDCGGTLISESFVLTAAHCANSRKGPPVIVRLGAFNLMREELEAAMYHQPGYLGTRDGASTGDYRISGILKHPSYRPPAKYNDIALLRLERPVKSFTPYVRPACLYTHPTMNVSAATATGWGRIDFAEDLSDILLKVSLNIIDHNACNELYLDDRRTNRLPQGISQTMMCAGQLEGGKDTCQGDSGGPIQIRSQANNCIHYIVGVTSFGKHCAAPNAPGVYTRVSSFVPWIESVVWRSG